MFFPFHFFPSSFPVIISFPFDFFCNLSQDNPNQSYFAVFDGHGGLEAAEYAATHLHGHLVSNQKFLTDPEAAMTQAYKTTDIKFLEKAKREVSFWLVVS